MNDEVVETAVCPECGDDAEHYGYNYMTGPEKGLFKLYVCNCGLWFDETEIE